MVISTDAANAGKKGPQLQCTTLDADVVIVDETWRWPGKGENDLLLQHYSIFRRASADGRIKDRTLTLVAERYDAREGYKMHTQDIQAP